jgi:hypothetical protein
VLAEGSKPATDTAGIDAKEVGDLRRGIIALKDTLDGEIAPALKFSG